jgi:hypothetical protein
MRDAVTFVGFVVLSAALARPVWTAEPAEVRMRQTLQVSAAMKAGREALQTNNAAQAIAVLEASILHCEGQPAYLLLLRDAYRLRIRQLQLAGDKSDTIAHLQRQLQTIEATTIHSPTLPAATPPEPVKQPAAVEPVSVQTSPAAGVLGEADRSFTQGDFSRARGLYREALAAGATLQLKQKECYAYAQLHGLAIAVQNGECPADAAQQIENAKALGGAKVHSFAQTLLQTVPRVGMAGNFVVSRSLERLRQGDLIQYAEDLRKQALERWTGSPGHGWKAPCELHLYESADAYAKATGRSARYPASAMLESRGGKSQTRRIDIAAPDGLTLETYLPREIHYLVLADLFAEEPLPYWAEIGIPATAASRAEIARNRRMMAKIVQDAQTLAFDEFLQADAGKAPRDGTRFYLQSATLAEYLLRLKGPRTLMVLLQEAPRRGFERGLRQHYGFKDIADLEKQWKDDLRRADGNTNP